MIIHAFGVKLSDGVGCQGLVARRLVCQVLERHLSERYVRVVSTDRWFRFLHFTFILLPSLYRATDMLYTLMANVTEP